MWCRWPRRGPPQPSQPPATAVDLYAFDGPLDAILGVLALQAGPWQFCILSFFVVTLVAAPALLWALGRGAWGLVLAGSLATYAVGRRPRRRRSADTV